jgi:hypothetical protein
MIRVARAVVLLALVLAGCSQTGPRISHDQAIAIASRNVGSEVQLVSVDFSGFDTGRGGQWIVRFTGDFGVPCPAPATGTLECPHMHNVEMAVDAQTGDVLNTTYH